MRSYLIKLPPEKMGRLKADAARLGPPTFRRSDARRLPPSGR